MNKTIKLWQSLLCTVLVAAVILGGVFFYVSKLRSGVEQLYDGAQQLADGSNQIKDGLSQVSDGTGSLDDGLKQYTDGVSQVDGGLGTLQDGLGTYTDGVAQVDDGLVFGMRHGRQAQHHAQNQHQGNELFHAFSPFALGDKMQLPASTHN